MLRVMPYLRTSRLGDKEKLNEYGIETLNPLLALREFHELNGSARIDVMIIDADAIDEARQTQLREYCIKNGVSIIVVANLARDSLEQYLGFDVDGIVPANTGVCEMACAIWSAHRQMCAQRELNAEIEILRLKIEQKRQIDRAVSILARKSNVTEKEALRKLRHEARNSRRTMYDLANVVIEAQDIMTAVF